MSMISRMKQLAYGKHGEPITYGEHALRYVPGTRPVRLKYIDAADITVRNDAQQIQFFLNEVKPGDFVLDVGGHFGQYAVLFAALAGDKGRVVTFEPDAVAHPTLRRNLELNGFQDRVRIESMALFDVAGQHEFYSRGADSMSSLALSGLGANSAKPDVQTQKVSTVRLDDYLSAAAGALPDIVKVDTEGAEVQILRGGHSFLKSGKGIIVCELHPYAWKEFGTSFDELLVLIRECGRKVRYLDPSCKIENGPVYGAVVIT